MINDTFAARVQILTAAAARLALLDAASDEAATIAKAAALFVLRADAFLQADGTVHAAGSLDAKRLVPATQDAKNATVRALASLITQADTDDLYWEQIVVAWQMHQKDFSAQQQLDALQLLLLGRVTAHEESQWMVQGSKAYGVTLADPTELLAGFQCGCLQVAVAGFGGGAPCKHVLAAAMDGFAASVVTVE